MAERKMRLVARRAVGSSGVNSIVPLLYPAAKTFDSGLLHVSSGHRLYFEQRGTPHGSPVLYLHGGPGAGTQEIECRLFSHLRRAVFLDQRGSGRSRPYASLEENNIDALIHDIESLREYLKIDSWQVVGGSWGSTLALAYALRFPERVLGLVLSGFFKGTQDAADEFLDSQRHAATRYPFRYKEFSEFGDGSIPLTSRYYQALSCADTESQEAATKSFMRWDRSLCTPLPTKEFISRVDGEVHELLSLARIFFHYYCNDFFLDTPLVDEVGRLRGIPVTVLCGTQDWITPLKYSRELSSALPGSKLEIVDGMGHMQFTVDGIPRLIAAIEEQERAFSGISGRAKRFFSTLW